MRPLSSERCLQSYLLCIKDKVLIRHNSSFKLERFIGTSKEALDQFDTLWDEPRNAFITSKFLLRTRITFNTKLG